MKIISFSWTTPAVKALRKSVTRREWNKEYAGRFYQDELIQAYDKSPRNGGKPFGIVQLLKTPYLESTEQIPDSDWEDEGFAYLEAIGVKCGNITPQEIWQQWKFSPVLLYVVRFKVKEIFKP